jgi:hypothetical protein
MEIPFLADIMSPSEYIDLLLSPEIGLPDSKMLKAGKLLLGCLQKIC